MESSGYTCGRKEEVEQELSSIKLHFAFVFVITLYV